MTFLVRQWQWNEQFEKKTKSLILSETVILGNTSNFNLFYPVSTTTIVSLAYKCCYFTLTNQICCFKWHVLLLLNTRFLMTLKLGRLLSEIYTGDGGKWTMSDLPEKTTKNLLLKRQKNTRKLLAIFWTPWTLLSKFRQKHLGPLSKNINPCATMFIVLQFLLARPFYYFFAFLIDTHVYIR